MTGLLTFAGVCGAGERGERGRGGSVEDAMEKEW